MAPPQGREFLWPINTATYARYAVLRDRLCELDETEEEALLLREELRALPGFPQLARSEDLITLVPTRTPFSFRRKVVN